MISKSIIVENSKILVLGLTFKENCPDIRNSKVIDVINELKDYNTNVDIFDPWVDSNTVKKIYNLDMVDSSYSENKYDAIILAVAHQQFLELDLKEICHKDTIVFDVKSALPKNNKLNIYQL